MIKTYKKQSIILSLVLFLLCCFYPYMAKAAIPVYKTTITNTLNRDGTVVVNKRIPKLEYDKLKNQNPSELNKAKFSFQLKGKEGNKKPYDKTQTIDFSTITDAQLSEHVKAVTINGTATDYVVLSTTFEEVPFGNYTLVEKSPTGNTTTVTGTTSTGKDIFNGNPSNNANSTVGTGSDAVSFGNAAYVDGNDIKGTVFMLDQFNVKEALADTNKFAISTDGKTVTFTLDKDTDALGVEINAENIPNDGDIKITKKDDAGTLLEGVEFRLLRKDETDASKAITLTTNAQGVAHFKNLPLGTYMLTETKTVKGYNLLKDPVEITIPYSATLEVANQQRLDLTKAVYSQKAKRYYVYELSYDIKNTPILKLPKTGAFPNTWLYALVVIGCLMIAGAVYALQRKKAPIPVTPKKES